MESNHFLIAFIIVLFSSMNEANRLKSVYYYDSSNSIATRANPNINLPLKIIVHGFTETKDGPNADGYVTDMKNAILKYDSQNVTVMVVNWDTGSDYDSSVINISSQAGEDLVNLLIGLGINEKNIHCIGHSLGAQMCGFAGQHWFKKKGTKFARITGLDPSGPNFGIVMSAPVNERLDKDDATYVDVYHTNSGVWGINYNAGHSDFWINGVYGSYQPGCLTDTTTVKGFCSHKRSWAYFIASIQNKNCFTKFTDVTGFKNLKTKFGYWSDQIIPNIYLTTGVTPPFCQ